MVEDPPPAAPRAVYVHVPFCRRRCGYCNFTVVAGRDDLQEPYLQAIEQELRSVGGPVPVDTLYLGGGTPTALTPARLARLCALLRETCPPRDGYEWSAEANPDGLDPARLEALRAAGVNRLSLGAQSFDPHKLEQLQRTHRPADIRQIYPLVRAAFPSVSLDLICAVPGETGDQWRADLDAALALEPDHLSVYTLTFEKGTTFWGRRLRGTLRPPDEETQRARLELAWDRLIAAGWEHYEVSNFARPGHRCRHNEVYWRGEPYLAVGPGAARYVDGCRETNHRSTFTYLRRVRAGLSPVAESERLTAVDRAREMLVFRLRMLEGISRAEFRQRTGCDLDELAGRPLRRFAAWGLVQDTGDRIRLTREGLLVSDALWPDLL
ncbi:MAG: radical SAM family heme chaperone HemW [Pirellulaceae bacterium]|jgi:oxygen-independent coproporphyrinogen-3 oxidase|nr:radical SAM family heme chaperone HemW [Pirellulaceae bacterium]